MTNSTQSVKLPSGLVRIFNVLRELLLSKEDDCAAEDGDIKATMELNKDGDYSLLLVVGKDTWGTEDGTWYAVEAQYKWQAVGDAWFKVCQDWINLH